MRTRAIVAEEHRILRDGVRSMLQEDNIEVVADTDSGIEAVRLTNRINPHLVLIDIDIPELGAVEATRQIVTVHPTVKVIIMSLHSDARLVNEALKAGAASYVGDDCDATQLAAAVDAVMRGQTYLSPAVTKLVVAKYLNPLEESGAAPDAGLTSREREVLKLLAEGRSIKEIALALHRSGKTIVTHRQHVMEKLNLSNIAELTKYAIREGLTNADQ